MMALTGNYRKKHGLSMPVALQAHVVKEDDC